MSLGESRGGLPPDACVENEEAILNDCIRVIESFHDSTRGAMTRIVLGPCSPFSVSTDLLIESAKLARAYHVSLHTHLCETRDEERYTLEKYGLRPVAWMDSLGWLGDDVWFAHAIHVDDDEIRRFAAGGVGMAHCPCSLMRLGSGIAPIKKYLAAGVKVSLGVDGSASNDASNMLLEARQAPLLARLVDQDQPARRPWLSAREALEIATRGGAAVLGRDDIGSLEPGKCADFFSINLRCVDYAGALNDPVAATLFCAPQKARYTVINGRVIVENGAVTTVDMGPVIECTTGFRCRLRNEIGVL